MNATSLFSLITCKQDWRKKVGDEQIKSNWRNELILQKIPSDYVDVIFKVLETMVHDGKHDTYLLSKKYKIEMFINECNCDCYICNHNYGNNSFDPDLIVSVVCQCAMKFSFEREKFLSQLVVRKQLINDILRIKLINEVSFLEAQEPDWHPYSNEQVLDLVHPSLFCYVDSLSQVLPDIKRYNKKMETPNVLQWLPAEIKIYKKNKYSVKAKFLSPINGLDSNRHEDLYRIIEEIFAQFYPELHACMFKYLKNYDSSKNDLQVIVKLANTVLTPDKPAFPGGSWHLEGHSSENIVATGIYYYQNENIMDSGLYTRIPIDEEADFDYPQDDFKGIPVHYSVKGERELESVQHLGPVPTLQNDCLIFPNFVQHRVSPFCLRDNTKPGYRKILLFWIVDPTKRVISTGDVESPKYNLEDAKFYRECLMYQRQNEVDEREAPYKAEISLCEH